MTASTVRVKPAAVGGNLSHPAGGRPLSDAGDVWPNDGWTQRRIAEGGVVVVTEDDPPTPDAAPRPSRQPAAAQAAASPPPADKA